MEKLFKGDLGKAIFLLWAMITLLIAVIPNKQEYASWIHGYEPCELAYDMNTNAQSSLCEDKRIAIEPILKKDILEYLMTGKSIRVTNQYPSMYIDLKNQGTGKTMCFGIIFSSTGDLIGIDITEFDSRRNRSFNRKRVVINSNLKLQDKLSKELSLIRDQLRDS